MPETVRPDMPGWRARLLGIARPRSAIAASLPGAIAGLAAAAAILGCGPPRTLTAAQRGEVVYRTNCASCHNRNPNLPGAIGPAIAGASRALIEARVMHAAYPAGYHPQRKTHLMRPLPWLEPHIGDLTAYLDSVAVRH
jgi:mono/diheme cytochrome c family protein